MLYDKDSYVCNRRCVLGDIKLYDITKANISILKPIIGDEVYTKLYTSSKQYREVYIGKYLRDHKDINQVLSNGFREYRKRFYDSNGLEDKDILMIAKDSYYILDKECNYLDFDSVHFRLDSIFDSFYNLSDIGSRLIIFYDSKSKYIVLNGMKDSQYLHEEYFCRFLREVFDYHRQSITKAIEYIRSFYKIYRDRELPIQFYREFNSLSNIRLCNDYDGYLIHDLYMDTIDINNVDISYNALVIQSLYKILLNTLRRNR